ncbi:MAG: proline dehydrogenase family protein [Anaerolineales bacterium]
MLRDSFLYLSRAGWAQTAITRVPLAWQMASRFVAGESFDAAITTIRRLNAKGIHVTLDFLGESLSTRAEAAAAADEYVRAVRAIAENGVRANVSLKLTQFGLDIDPAFCTENVHRVVAEAKATDNFVRIDMEGTAHTDLTLGVLAELRRNFDNVGTVLQAYLYRTEADLLALADAGTRIRLCKGAYQEPPDKAYPQKADTDANYVKLAKLLLDRADNAPTDSTGRTPPLPALATHDEKMIAAVKTYAAEKSTPRDRFEFQMLYGVRRELQEQLVREGYAVRAYVPYGTHWYPYFMRRLAERPANVWFFVSNYFRR